MTCENYFLYILPYSPNYKEYKPILEGSGWRIKKDSIYFFDPYSNYKTYNKEINFNREWALFFREFPILKSLIIVIKCLDSTYKKEDQYKDSRKILHNILNECEIVGLNIIKNYIFEFYNSQNDLNKKKEQCNYSFLFSEITTENELHQFDLSTFLLKVNCNRTLNELIIDNIYTLVSLSEIAYDLEHRILNKSENVEQIDIIKAFWSQKIFLLSCPASKTYPLFFKYNISVITNLLDNCQMRLVENQTELINNQTNLVARQNDILKQIHLVEGGILFLTFFVIIDVLFTIAFEVTHSAWSALIAALIMFYISSKFHPLKKFVKELYSDESSES